ELRGDGAGGNWTAVLSSLGSPEALHLRLLEPGAVEPTARKRSWTQCRGDVAAGSVGSGSQDDRRLPQRQQPGAPQGCARFVELCREMGLLATASVAIDGSKFKAVNNRDKNFTRAKVERRRAQLEES